MLCSPVMGSADESSNDPKLDPKNDEQLAPEEERPSCPKCGSQDVRRSHGEGLMPALLRILGRWPFRCRSCRARFYRSAPPPEDD
jgi:Zn finger protein HypA/HybF involved in hydrogenase expression